MAQLVHLPTLKSTSSSSCSRPPLHLHRFHLPPHRLLNSSSSSVPLLLQTRLPHPHLQSPVCLSLFVCNFSGSGTLSSFVCHQFQGLCRGMEELKVLVCIRFPILFYSRYVLDFQPFRLNLAGIGV